MPNSPAAAVERPKDLIQSAQRALLLLESVARHPGPVAPKELATELNLGVATVYHLLNTLLYTGYVERVSGGYVISAPKIHSLYTAATASHAVDARTVRVVHHIAEITGETVYAARLIGLSVVISVAAEGSRAVRVAGLYPGLHGNEHARATGKALLAFASLATIEEFLSRPGGFPAVTPTTIVDPDELRAELVRVSKAGYAVDDQEYLEGVGCISVPVRRPGVEPTVAITITVPAHRFAATRDSYLKLLQDNVRQLVRDTDT
jgi:IclR family acetate operon transcriptional repressor